MVLLLMSWLTLLLLMVVLLLVLLPFVVAVLDCVVTVAVANIVEMLAVRPVLVRVTQITTGVAMETVEGRPMANVHNTLTTRGTFNSQTEKACVFHHPTRGSSFRGVPCEKRRSRACMKPHGKTCSSGIPSACRTVF